MIVGGPDLKHVADAGVFTLGLFGSFDSYNDKLINYDVPAEVEKVIRQ